MFKRLFLTAALAAVCFVPAYAEIPAVELAACEARFSTAIPDDMAPVSELADIDAWLARFESWGLNPDGVSVADLEYQFVVDFKDDSPLPYNVPAWISVVLKSPDTGKCQVFATRPMVPNHYATAGGVIALTQE